MHLGFTDHLRSKLVPNSALYFRMLPEPSNSFWSSRHRSIVLKTRSQSLVVTPKFRRNPVMVEVMPQQGSRQNCRIVMTRQRGQGGGRRRQRLFEPLERRVGTPGRDVPVRVGRLRRRVAELLDLIAQDLGRLQRDRAVDVRRPRRRRVQGRSAAVRRSLQRNDQLAVLFRTGICRRATWLSLTSRTCGAGIAQCGSHGAGGDQGRHQASIEPSLRRQSRDRRGSHHASILVFEDVTVIHKGILPRRAPIKGHQGFGSVFDEHHVLPTRQMSGRRCAAERQNAK
jgi:hypothetical protein